LILLSLGTHQQPFPRALDLVEPLALGGERLLVQHGSTPPRTGMPNTSWVEFMAFDELVATMQSARSVVCHAGVGTIVTAIRAGHVPVVIPRQPERNEHVDGHQMDIASRYAERGLIRCVLSDADLLPLLAPRCEDPSPAIGKGSEELRSAVLAAVAGGPRRGRLRMRPR
jgi:UDP-N-acetylglucosamine transferase subunit ALG13